MSRMLSRIPTVEAPPGASADVAVPGTPSSSQLLRLLHLASPALPIGAFHFSQGLEYAVDAGWMRDEASALDWIGGMAGSSLATLDLPVLHRLHAAWHRSDHPSVLRWNAFLIAARETAESRAEDRHLGSALLRVLAEFALCTDLFSASASKPAVGVSYAAAFGFACAQWRIDAHAGAQAFAWAWLENQVLAAIKLVPLGQSAGQRVLHTLATRLGALCERSAELDDSDIGVCTFSNAIASARHEIQYSRLFRS